MAKKRGRKRGVSSFQACMKKALKGKHIKGKMKWRAAFSKAAKACGRKVRK
ncbi:hypothetical protein MUP77_21220 [Candidatus Bathyarchaeota archaeon]|nr:hypothetical protein [Candidatus Bathyarchaeota archaeon]